MQIREFNLRMPRYRKKWQAFMEKNGIHEFGQAELDPIEKTYVWEEGGEMAATGSIAGKVLKYVAVCEKFKDGGALFNQVVSHLVNEEATRGRFHLLVFTKPKYVASFGYVGFKPLAQTDQGALLESGTPGIDDYLAGLPHFDGGQTGAIVMNANPFTKGHRALVEKASAECDQVYLFVVQADRSVFTFKERFELVKQGVSDLANVVVVPGSDYMVSSATFPAYFLKSDQEIGAYQAKLDATLFRDAIAKPLGIDARYLGEEPTSKTTAAYNAALAAVLAPQVAVKIMPRHTEDGQIVSATTVRQAILAGDQDQLARLLPTTTLAFVQAHFADLQARIQKKGSK